MGTGMEAPICLLRAVTMERFESVDTQYTKAKGLEGSYLAQFETPERAREGLMEFYTGHLVLIQGNLDFGLLERRNAESVDIKRIALLEKLIKDLDGE